MPTKSDSGPRGPSHAWQPGPASSPSRCPACGSRLVHSQGRHHGRDREGSTSNERQRPGRPSGARASVLRPFYPLVRKWAARPKTRRLEAARLRGVRRNGTGRPPGQCSRTCGRSGTDTPGSVFEGSAMAPMRGEPSLSRRKPRAAATGGPAGSLSLLPRTSVPAYGGPGDSSLRAFSESD